LRHTGDPTIRTFVRRFRRSPPNNQSCQEIIAVADLKVAKTGAISEIQHEHTHTHTPSPRTSLYKVCGVCVHLPLCSSGKTIASVLSTPHARLAVTDSLMDPRLLSPSSQAHCIGCSKEVSDGHSSEGCLCVTREVPPRVHPFTPTHEQARRRGGHGRAGAATAHRKPGWTCVTTDVAWASFSVHVGMSSWSVLQCSCVRSTERSAWR